MGKQSTNLPRSAAILLLCGVGLSALAGCAEDSGVQWASNDGALGAALSQAAGGVVPAAENGIVPAQAGPAAAAASALPPVYPSAAVAWSPPPLPSSAAPGLPAVPAQPVIPAAVPALPTPPQAPAPAKVERVADATELPSRNLQQVVAPNWAVGSEWRYSDGYGLTVSRADGVTTTFTRLDDPQQWFSRRGFLRQEEQSATAHREAVFLTAAPDAGRVLQAGKPLTFRREYMSNGELKVHATSWSLEGTDRITVPAGTFDCAIIVMRTRNLVTGWTGFERWWYSPEVQNYVRIEYRYGDGPVGSRVLTAYRLTNPQVPRVAMADR